MKNAPIALERYVNVIFSRTPVFLDFRAPGTARPKPRPRGHHDRWDGVAYPRWRATRRRSLCINR